jgi:cystathionine beta-lyase/cystathionine gamma-synthase
MTTSLLGSGRPRISDGMVRLFVGLEDVEDLWTDLAQALEG